MSHLGVALFPSDFVQGPSKGYGFHAQGSLQEVYELRGSNPFQLGSASETN